MCPPDAIRHSSGKPGSASGSAPSSHGSVDVPPRGGSPLSTAFPRPAPAPFAALTPTSSDPASPGPFVTAMPSNSPSCNPTLPSALRMTGVSVTRCCRDATSGDYGRRTPREAPLATPPRSNGCSARPRPPPRLSRRKTSRFPVSSWPLPRNAGMIQHDGPSGVNRRVGSNTNSTLLGHKVCRGVLNGILYPSPVRQ